MPWLATALFIMGMAILLGLYWNSTVTVRKVTFSGNYFVDKEELRETVNIPLGIAPDSLDFMRISGKLEQIPYVGQARVDVEPGGNLEIVVTERQPIAMLTKGTEKIYVDKAGIMLPIINGKAADVPILYGFKPGRAGDTLQSDAWRATRSFLAAVQQHPVYNATISEVAWTGREEGVVALSHENGVKLIFGRDAFDTRLRNWKAFYGQVIREKGIDRMRSVDLRFEGQIVTREQ